MTIGAAALQNLGMLMNPTPLGDDVLIHVQKIVDLSINFSHFQWDPRSFNGYAPPTGFAWASYGPPALFVSVGLDPTIVFHTTFVIYFLALMPSIYYLARSVGAQRYIALAVSVLGWSTAGYWGYIGGGAYSRVFTLPFMFVALALTYRYVTIQNAGQLAGRLYWILLAAWFATILGDLYVAIVAVAVAVPFLLLSADWRHTRLGGFRLAGVLLPALALTSWFWIPTAAHALLVGSPPSESTVFPTSQVFWAGPTLSAIAVLYRRRFSAEQLRPERAAMLFSLNLVSVYFLIMGAVTPLWPYIPRIWATYDSFNLLSFLFPITVACLFAWFKPPRRQKVKQLLGLLLLIVVISNAIPTVLLSGPPDRTLQSRAFAQAFNGNFISSDDFRVSLQGRTSTRWFPFYYPDASQTGGRVRGLDPNPYYQSWYDTEVFFKDDLATLNSVYLEDQPQINVRSLIGAPQNFASTTYWLDWHGVGTVVLDPAFYPVNNTVQGFSQRGALFITKTVQTSYGPLVFVTPSDRSPISVATNAPTIGFYSEQKDSVDDYNALLALLSYLGLDSRFVVPIYLSSLDFVNPAAFSIIVTDQVSYLATSVKMRDLEARGTRVIVVSPAFLDQLQSQGPSGTSSLISFISPTIPVQMQDLTISSFVPSRVLTLPPQQWIAGYNQNANGQIQTSQNNLTLTLNIPDSTRVAQFNLDATLPNSVILSSDLTASLLVESDLKFSAGLAFHSSNFTSNSVRYDHEVNQNQWSNLQVPFTNFTLWGDPQSKFALANGFSISITIPPGHNQATIQLDGVSLLEPSHATYTTSSEIFMAAAGFIQVPQKQGMMTILSDPTGNLRGSYEERGPQFSTNIIPFRAFTSSSNRTFTKIFVVDGSNAQPATMALFPQSNWIPIESMWRTNENLGVGAVSGGFRGIVWKETFTGNWNIQGTSPSNDILSLPYFSAGPGKVYIPLNGAPLVKIDISFRDIISGLVIPLLAASFLVPLILFRRRIYGIGALRRPAT